MSAAASAERMPFVLRRSFQGDRGHIVSSWLKNYGRSREALRLAPQVYFEGQTRLIERLLFRSRILVAASQADQDQIFGWIVGETEQAGRDEAVTVVHYVYVKRLFRRMGIAKALVLGLRGGVPTLPESGGRAVKFYTHIPAIRRNDPEYFPDMAALLAKLAPGAEFNPYLLL